MFYAGLLTSALALASPTETLSTRLLWVQMIQQLLLVNVAAPLIVLGAPWLSLWRALPLTLRRTLTRSVRSRWLTPVRAVTRVLARPLGALLAVSVNLLVWHLPAVFDVTLRNVDVHMVEDLTFLGLGILLWAQVIESSPFKPSLTLAGRIGYIGAVMLPNIALSMVLTFARSPLYEPYVHLVHRPGGISALADQQIAAGVMWSAGDLSFGIAIALLVDQWLTATMARLS